MIVVADTSPINYLILIEEIAVLRKLYSHVVIPHSVHAELVRPSAPDPVRKFMESPPAWMELRTPSETLDSPLAKLDIGEREAIALAVELRASRLLIDDLEGRRLAEQRGLRVTGTIGVLREAAAEGLVDLTSVVVKLQKTNFYLSPEIWKRLQGE